MKKIEKLELKLYEKLGIRKFQRLGFVRRNFFTCAIIYPFTRLMNRKERYNCVDKLFYSQKSNYNLGEITNLDDIKKYKKYPLVNGIRYSIDLLTCIPIIIKIIDGRSPFLSTISTTSAVVINMYCIMLQRYNTIRLNRVIKKVEVHQERKAKEERKEEPKAIKKASVKEVITNSTIEQLKRYRNYLVQYQQEHIKECNSNIQSQVSVKSRIRK